MVYVDQLICKNCNTPVKTGMFCAAPSYCRYEYMHKIRNPKLSKIINLKSINFYYLLGLIATDGNLHKAKGYGIEINIHTKDKNLLKKIQKMYGGSLKDKKDNTTVWYISYKPFYDYLCSIGITPAKSLTLDVVNFFNNLTSVQKNAFIRGVVDGDGGVRIYNQTNPKYPTKTRQYLVFDIVSGSKVFLDMLAKYINAELKENILNVKKEKTIYAVRSFAKYKPIKILDLLYKNIGNNLKMDRKYNTYKLYKKTLHIT